MSDVSTKTCTKCGEVKSLDEFYVKDKRTGRRFSWCKACHLALTAARYVPAPPRVRVLPTEKACTGCGRVLPIAQFHYLNGRSQTYRARCKACRVAEKVAYRAANGAQIKATDAAYREANRAELAERQRAWREAHPESYGAIHSKWKTENKDLVNASTHKRRNTIKGAGHHWTAAEWQALKARYGHTCLLCGRKEPDIDLTVDHVVPVSRGGGNTIDNIQPLCKGCNSRKHVNVLDLRTLYESEEGGS